MSYRRARALEFAPHTRPFSPAYSNRPDNGPNGPLVGVISHEIQPAHTLEPGTNNGVIAGEHAIVPKGVKRRSAYCYGSFPYEART